MSVDLGNQHSSSADTAASSNFRPDVVVVRSRMGCLLCETHSAEQQLCTLQQKLQEVGERALHKNVREWYKATVANLTR